MFETSALLTLLALSSPVDEAPTEAPAEPTYRLSDEEMLQIDIDSIVVVSPIPFLNVFYVDEEEWERQKEERRAKRKERRKERKRKRQQSRARSRSPD